MAKIKILYSFQGIAHVLCIFIEIFFVRHYNASRHFAGKVQAS